MTMKTYEGKLYLKSGGGAIPVRVQARTSSEAKKLLEAQYGGQFKRWSTPPREVRK